jgi:hypothetical protein
MLQVTVESERLEAHRPPNSQLSDAKRKGKGDVDQGVDLQTSHNVGEVAHTDECGGPTSVGVFEEHRHDELFEHKSQCTEGLADSVTLTKGRTERTAVFHADESEYVQLQTGILRCRYSQRCTQWARASEPTIA